MEQAGNVGGFCGSGQIAPITTTPYLARMVLQLVPDANEGDGGLIYVAMSHLLAETGSLCEG